MSPSATRACTTPNTHMLDKMIERRHSGGGGPAEKRKRAVAAANNTKLSMELCVDD